MYVQGRPVEIQSLVHWNLIGSLFIAQQFSSAAFLSLRLHARKGKFGIVSKNVAFPTFLYVLKIVYEIA